MLKERDDFVFDSDSDMKIAGDKPSVDVKRNAEKTEQKTNTTALSDAAKKAAQAVAEQFISDASISHSEDFTDHDMILQRRLLLSFTATVGFEEYIKNDTLCGIAQKSFLDALNKHSRELYLSSSDTGAFSFYYLAFRRGGDIERRIGQTFAMLCSHDGDPIFQELGEALYCWFSSVVKKAVNEYMAGV